MTRKSDPDGWYDPDEEAPDTTVRDLVKAYARIAELEAEREHAVYAYVSTRIAELEAQVLELGKGESREWVKSTQLDELQARIAELEALSTPDAIQRHYMRGYNAANARRRRYYVAELESDRDTLSRIIDTLGTDNRRLEAEVARLTALQLPADLSRGEALAYRSEDPGPAKKPIR